MAGKETPWVLDEDDALDLLAFLLTSARTQVDEAREYGPLRLIMAAHRVADAMSPRSSPETQALLAPGARSRDGRLLQRARCAHGNDPCHRPS